MINFQIGQAVICVKVEEHDFDLTLGRVYVVCNFGDNNYIIIVDDNLIQYDYKADQFRPLPNPLHKHKDCIIAWAQGADIEMLDPFGSGTDWILDVEPFWLTNLKYRIKKY